MTAWQKIRSFFFVPRCLGCGLRLSSGETFCPACRLDFENGRTRECPSCGKRLAECLCASPELARHRVRTLHKIYPYRPGDAQNGVNRMLYHIKHVRPKASMQFAVRELSAAIGERYRPEDGWIVTFAPRTRRAKAKYGYDHGEALARMLAKELSLPFSAMLRRYGNKEQKHLNREQRKANAVHAFSLIRRKDAQGKRFLLFDDIVTTGATMGACAEVLYQAGARRVVGVCLATTIHS